MNRPIKNFLLILAAALFSAVLGGLFAAAISALSPEFVSGVFSPRGGNLVRYAASVGAVWGLFIGAAAMAFAIYAAVLINRPQSQQKLNDR